MRTLLVCLVILVMPIAAAAQSPPPTQEHYFFYQLVLLRRPPDAPNLDQAALEKLQHAHLANIRKLADEGKLVMAGPFLDDTPLRGIFVFKTQSQPEAARWSKTDPAVQAHRLMPEFHTWIQPTSTFSRPPDSNPMENYVAVLYVKGAHYRSLAEPYMRPEISRHVAFLQSLRESGRMVVGGPFKDGTGDHLALLIFPTTPEEALQIVAGDPFVQSGEVKPEVHPWMTKKGVLPK